MEYQECPFCGRKVPARAVVCMRCHAKLTVNNEPQKEVSAEEQERIDALKKINFGALVFSPLWAIAHRQWGIACILIVPNIVLAAIYICVIVVYRSDPQKADVIYFIYFMSRYLFWGITLIIVPLYLLSFGNDIAWRSGRFPTIQNMLETQRTWAHIGIVFTIAIACLFILRASLPVRMGGYFTILGITIRYSI